MLCEKAVFQEQLEQDVAKQRSTYQHVKSDKKQEKWKQKSEALRRRLAVRETSNWCGRKTLFGVPDNERTRDLINVAADVMEQRHGSAENVFIDCSQDVDRQPWGPLRSITTSTEIYSTTLDRMLVPREHFLLLGFASEISLQHCSARAARDLAGESMSPACIALIQVAVIMTLFKDSLKD